LRFFRLICLLNTPDLLQLLHIIKSNHHIRIAKALSLVLVVWVLGAGMYFLVSHVTSFYVIIIIIIIIIFAVLILSSLTLRTP